MDQFNALKDAQAIGKAMLQKSKYTLKHISITDLESMKEGM